MMNAHMLLSYMIEHSERAQLDLLLSHPEQALQSRRCLTHALAALRSGVSTHPDRALFKALISPRIVSLDAVRSVLPDPNGNPWSDPLLELPRQLLLEQTSRYVQPYSRQILDPERHRRIVRRRQAGHFATLSDLYGARASQHIEEDGVSGNYVASVAAIEPDERISIVSRGAIRDLLSLYEAKRKAEQAGTGRLSHDTPSVDVLDSRIFARLGIVGFLHIADTSSGDPSDWALLHKGVRIHLPVSRQRIFASLGTLDPLYGAAVRMDYARAVLQRKPVYTRVEAVLDGTHRAYHRLMLPLRDRQDADRLLILALPDAASFPAAQLYERARPARIRGEEVPRGEAP